MTWHYIPIKKYVGKNIYYYVVGERYSGCGIASDIAPMGMTKKELIRDLEMMLEDVKRYKTERVK